MSKLPPLVPRTDFGKAPAGYVPGLGRGAVGFTTRSDIGPARPAADIGTARGTAPPPGFEEEQRKAKKEADYSESNFDKFSGFQERLFDSDKYTEEDKEADAIYDAIDRRMDSKRKARREAKEKEVLEEFRKKRPKIAEQFRDLKRGLATVSDNEWNDIPEPLDYTRRNRRLNQRADKFTAVPDSVATVGAAFGGGVVGSLDRRQQMYGGFATPVGGFQTPMGAPGWATPGFATPAGFATPMGGWATPGGFATPSGGSADLTQLGKARDKVLSLKLDRMADSVSGQTVVDPKGYLTDLNALKVNSEAEVSDIKKARMLLNSVITTNPKHGPGWIAAARLEAETGKVLKARQVIMKGCKMCPKSEDVWLEAAQLHTPQNAKAILAQAVRHIPTSVKIWLAARDLEDSPEAKKAVLRRGLDLVPTSVRLWKAAIEQESPEDARILLSRAVECVPHSVEMWLALARLESYANAKKVLNRARKANPGDPSIWITAARLEEANGNVSNVDSIIKAAIRSLSAHNVVIDRDTWLSFAEEAEKSQSIITCQAIVRHTLGLNVEEQDRRNTWLNDADLFLERGSVETARATYAHMLTVYRGKESIWLKAADLEKQHGTSKTLQELLQQAVKYCPQSETLWLRLAKEHALAGDVRSARSVLNAAFEANPESEDIWLAAVKLESENKEYTRASMLLANARTQSGTAHVWMKSAQLERQLGHADKELRLLEEGLAKHPKYAKMWMMLGQFHARQLPIQLKGAREAYRKGVRQCPQSVELWLCYFELEAIVAKNYARARSLLETARLRNPKSPHLWLASVRCEMLAGNAKASQQVLSKALQECPTAGILWAYAIAADPRPLRKSRSFDALKRCSDDAHVFLAVARLFWLGGKVKKAREWFNRAATVDPDLGDVWIYFLKFELQKGSAERQSNLRKKCERINPRHGELWTRISKYDVTRPQLSTVQILDKGVDLVTDHFPLHYYNIKPQWDVSLATPVTATTASADAKMVDSSAKPGVESNPVKMEDTTDT